MNIEELREAMERSDVQWEIADEPLPAESRLGYLPSEGVPPLDEQERLAESMAEEPLGAAAPSYPPSYDLRNVGGSDYITPIRDQATCGSCVAFGACAAVEGTLRVERSDPGLDVDLSEAQLFYCVALSQGRSCGGDNGGWYPKVALETFRTQGVPDEACFPYTPGDQACGACEDWQARATKIAEWQPLHTPPDAKAWISSRGPVVASMKVYADFELYRGDVYSHLAGEYLGGHCVCLVGYDDEQGYWVGKNSWGTDWGESGFFRIAYAQCGIDSGALGVGGVQPPG